MGVARLRKELVRIKAKRDCWDWFVQVEIKSILNKNYREVKILISHHIYIYRRQCCMQEGVYSTSFHSVFQAITSIHLFFFVALV
jgi:hypothetical protein